MVKFDKVSTWSKSNAFEDIIDVARVVVPILIILFIIRCLKRWIFQSTKKSGNSLLRRYNVKHVSAIADRFKSLSDVSEAVKNAGLESSNLIFGVDYTASNQYQGQCTFNGRSLHYMNAQLLNPYQHVISTIGETLERFDEDGIIPTFGFGDISTKDQSVFPFRTEGYCNGFRDVLQAYNQITPSVKMSGPTSFAPLIRRAIEIVKQTKSYHILVIVADGQVTSEAPTRDAIVEASRYPLSIIMIGVGDGPCEEMRCYDDRFPARRFDNFQFVDFNRVMLEAGASCDGYSSRAECVLALHALMEIPDQYREIRRLGLLDF